MDSFAFVGIEVILAALLVVCVYGATKSEQDNKFPAQMAYVAAGFLDAVFMFALLVSK